MGQASGNIKEYGQDANSPGTYKDGSYAVTAGFDKHVSAVPAVFGVYGKFGSHEITQDGGNSAEAENAELGIYGAVSKEKWGIGALLSGSYDSYSTKRRIAFADKTAEAEFNGITFGGSAKGFYKIQLDKNTTLMPYAGAEAKNSSYDGFKENAAGIYNLKVESGNYLRVTGKAGAEIDFSYGKWRFYANIEGKYLINGEYPEIKAGFSGTESSFYSRGYEEERFVYGSRVGGEVKLS